ncbi:MAG: DUF2997 domain-containing protein [Pirellulales bacterium]
MTTATSKTIEIIVSPTGQTRLETKGFAGNSCRDASRPFEAALGLSQAEQLTAEFHQAANTDQQLRQSG